VRRTSALVNYDLLFWRIRAWLAPRSGGCVIFASKQIFCAKILVIGDTPNAAGKQRSGCLPGPGPSGLLPLRRVAAQNQCASAFSCPEPAID
jgi:hypothetical protein